jgi:hypothetical protein
MLKDLPQDIVDAMADFTSWIPDRYVSEIEGEIVRRGLSYSPSEKLAERWKRPAIFDEPSALPFALIDVGQAARISAGSSWWCREFFMLYQLMAVGKAPAMELRLLNADPGRSTLVRLAQIYCGVNDLDPSTLAAQVARAAAGGDEGLRHLQTLAYYDNSTAPQTKSLAAINAEQRATLRAALTSLSGWLGLLAFMVSRQATDEQLSAMLVGDLAALRPRAQRWAVFAACRLAADPLGVAERLAVAEVGARAATAEYVIKFGGTSRATRSLLDRFLNDDDLQVQLAAGYQGPVDATAKIWTCWFCSQANGIADADCAHCSDGSRP